MVAPWVADYSLATPAAATLRYAGAVGVMRYTGYGRNDGAAITAGEYAALKAAGVAVGLVMEYSESWILNGYAWGKQIAQLTRPIERNMGIVDGVTYAAADFDITNGGPPASAFAVGQCQQALSTMQGMADGYGGWQYVGAYGSRYFCDWLAVNSPCRHFWSTQAWSNYVPMSSAGIYQYAGWPAGVPYVAGCDYNEIRGDWAPRGATLPPPPPPPPGGFGVSNFVTVDLNQQWRGDAPVLRQVRGLLESWNVKVGGKLITPDNASGADTRAAVAEFQKNTGLKVDLIVGPATWARLCLPLTGGHL